MNKYTVYKIPRVMKILFGKLLKLLFTSQSYVDNFMTIQMLAFGYWTEEN